MSMNVRQAYIFPERIAGVINTNSLMAFDFNRNVFVAEPGVLSLNLATVR